MGEIIVANETGIWRTRTTRRRPADERWQLANLDLVRGAPWRKNDDNPNIDGETMKGVVFPLEREALMEHEERDARSRAACATPSLCDAPGGLRQGWVFARMHWVPGALDEHVAAEAF